MIILHSVPIDSILNSTPRFFFKQFESLSWKEIFGLLNDLLSIIDVILNYLNSVFPIVSCLPLYPNKVILKMKLFLNTLKYHQYYPIPGGKFFNSADSF